MQTKKKLVKKLANKEYRHSWATESIKMTLPFQIQANREKREWSQTILGVKSDMKQNAVSRLESMDYGNLTVNTLLRLAYGFDVGLLVKFVPFSRLVSEFEDVSDEALIVESFDEDAPNLDTWCKADDASADVEMPTIELGQIDAYSAGRGFGQSVSSRWGHDNDAMLAQFMSGSTSEAKRFQYETTSR